MKPKSDRTLDRLLDEISPIEQAKTDAKMMLAARIADAMKAKKWKNKELLAAVGKTNPSIITKWLSGTHNFTVDTLVELEEALGISLINLEEKEQETVMTYHFVIRKEVQPYSEADDFNETMVLEDQESQHFNKEFTLHYNNLTVHS
ncbi:MAG: helix-turn-helix transcriptional regulator [Bacteroidales bacterium]